MSDQIPTRTPESYRVSPDAFAVPGERYLGNPAVVSKLLGQFCSQIEAIDLAVDGGQLSPEAAKSQIVEQIRATAGIFSGANEAYQIVKGYHDASLPGKLMVDLGPFWRTHQSGWAGDAVCVLFDWLASLLLEKMEKAQGDEMLLGVMMKPTMQYTVKVLLGIEERAPA